MRSLGVVSAVVLVFLLTLHQVRPQEDKYNPILVNRYSDDWLIRYIMAIRYAQEMADYYNMYRPVYTGVPYGFDNRIDKQPESVAKPPKTCKQVGEPVSQKNQLFDP